MSSDSILTPAVCFIVCDEGPSSDFAVFSRSLLGESNIKAIIHATGPALVKFKDSHLPADIMLLPFTIDDFNREQQERFAKELTNDCLKRDVRVIMTDIGNKFDAVFHNVLSIYELPSDRIHCWCYYDNPEAHVPGGYSAKAKETIEASKYVLFANMNLIKPDAHIYSIPERKIRLVDKTIRGIGYYPVADMETLQEQRDIEEDTLKAQNN